MELGLPLALRLVQRVCGRGAGPEAGGQGRSRRGRAGAGDRDRERGKSGRQIQQREDPRVGEKRKEKRGPVIVPLCSNVLQNPEPTLNPRHQAQAAKKLFFYKKEKEFFLSPLKQTQAWGSLRSSLALELPS